MKPNQNCGCQGGMPGMMPMPGRQPMAGGCQDTMSGMGRSPMFDGRSVMMPSTSHPAMTCPAQKAETCPLRQTMPADCFDRGRFPAGMGYVPMQNWETPYSMEQGFRRGTIFPSLDYPFMMGGCRR